MDVAVNCHRYDRDVEDLPSILRQAFSEKAAVHLAVDVQALYCDPEMLRRAPPRRAANGRDYPVNVVAVQDNVDRIASFSRLVRGVADTIWVTHVPPYAAMNIVERAQVRQVRGFGLFDRGEKVRKDIEAWGRRPAHPHHASDSEIQKKFSNAFHRTALNEKLADKNARVVLISGFWRNECVLHTAQGAKLNGLIPVVIDDLAPHVNRTMFVEEQENRRMFLNEGIWMMTSAQVMEILRP